MRSEFDVLVLGAGPAGSRVAELCGRAGMRVAVIDQKPFGGTCAVVGCNPKKVLAEATQWRAQSTGHAQLLGCDSKERPMLDWPKLHEYQQTFTDPVEKQKKAGFAEAGVEVIEGRARFTSPTTVQVSGEELRSENFVVAVGSRPRPLSIRGAELLTGSDEFLNAEELPQSVAFLGGGYIAMEFAHAASAAGREVVVCEQDPHGLAGFDAQLVERLIERSEDCGIRFRLGDAVESLATTDAGVRAELQSGDSVEADWFVHAAGRSPNTASLGLPAGRVDTDEAGGVVVDEACRSVSNDRVLAVGDCAANAEADLASVANTQGRQVARNLIDGEAEPVIVGVTPAVVFTTPRLARVEVAFSLDHHDSISEHRGEWDRSGFVRKWAGNELPTGYLLRIDHERDRLLGTQLLHPHAGELINVAATLIDTEAPLAHFVDTPLAYPSAGTQLQDAVRAAIEGQR